MGRDNSVKEKPLPPSLYTEEYFTTACEGYSEFLDSEGEHLSRRLKAAFELATIEPGMRVLDVGCGRGEILLHCARLGADAYGIDYAPVAMSLSKKLLEKVEEEGITSQVGISQADAKHLPFPDGYFDRALMFDVVEHLHPWELDEAMREVYRVLKPEGRFIVHTAPNVWYDRYAYPVVRFFRRLMGQGSEYPQNPRAFLVNQNQDVHVNEQSWWSLRRALRRNGFDGKVWLDSPPQNRTENFLLAAIRYILFKWIPMRWFFEREVFGVAAKNNA
ncbi:MAG: methyltransferase domain-containing protein [Chloroflexi bacterium]|nr:methyltransferase domain-containing protein [Chloroflexota bacterium]